MAKKNKRKKKPGMANFLVPGATILIVIAAIISFNSNNIANFLLNNVEEYGIDRSVAAFLSDNTKTDIIDENENIYDGPYTVKRVVDGDTFVVVIEDTDAKIRLIGIDTPENVAAVNYHKENTEEGKIASDYAKDLLTGRDIYLEFDVSKTDKYGRLFAYAYYEEDGQMTMVNKKLLSDGMAQLMTIQPNIKYVDLLIEAQEFAREANIGFWNNDLFADEKID